MSGNARMPEWFFRSASKRFNPIGNNRLLINGDCFLLDGRAAEIAGVSFDWESYRTFMLSPEGFSLEYNMARWKVRVLG